MNSIEGLSNVQAQVLSELFKKWQHSESKESFLSFWHKETGNTYGGPEFPAVMAFINYMNDKPRGD